LIFEQWVFLQVGKTSRYGNKIEFPTPETTVYFDRLGREIRTAQLRFDGSRLKIDRQFDQRGRLHKVSLPFKGDAPTHWNVYHYDEFDRITKIEHASGRTDTWSYSANSVTSTIDGMKSTQRFNAAGQLVEVTDGGGTITYRYRPDGQIREISVNGVITSFTYDHYGRQTSINDPSAGIQTYEFDSAGNLRSQTDARGQSIRMYYDEFHRLIRKEMPEFTTEYFYNEHGAISSIVSTNNTSRHFVYDSFGRLIREREYASDEKWLTTKYNYSGAFLSGISFVSSTDGNIVTENYFFQNGFLTEIKLNNETSIFRLTSENHMGQPTSLTTGVLSRTYEYDEFGFPVARKSTAGGNVVFHQTYRFDRATGNLMFRGDERNQGFEFFTYDAMNRLTRNEIYNAVGTRVGFRTVKFSPSGNIDEKSDVGLFNYTNPDRPFQLTEVISENRRRQFGNYQSVSYTSFQRPSAIIQDGYITLFTYNASGNRVRMETVNTSSFEWERRFYIGNRYEVDMMTNESILWLGGDAYSAPAALKRQFGGTWKIYYICRDYLGSIHVVTDEYGEIVQEVSFDPWGRLRNAQTHQLYAIGSEPRLFLGNRGFTGHEHLQRFGLINMNARLYDPLVGRFLSPDPFVQAPGFTQSFNRYSYAWNNPLKFIDPSGEVNYRFCRSRGWWFDGTNKSASESDVFLWMHGVGTGNNFSGMPCSMSNSWGNDLMRFSNFGGSWASVGASSRGVGSGGSWRHLHVHETELWWNITRNPDGSEHRSYYTREVYRGMEWVWVWNNSTADARAMNTWGSWGDGGILAMAVVAVRQYTRKTHVGRLADAGAIVLTAALAAILDRQRAENPVFPGPWTTSRGEPWTENVRGFDNNSWFPDGAPPWWWIPAGGALGSWWYQNQPRPNIQPPLQLNRPNEPPNFQPPSRPW